MEISDIQVLKMVWKQLGNGIGVGRIALTWGKSLLLGIDHSWSERRGLKGYIALHKVLNLPYAETFGLTTAEGFACGTPGIVYNKTASLELVTPETGIVCDAGDIDGVAGAVRTLLSKEKPIEACRKRAVEYYDKNDRYREYVELYEELVKKS